MTRKHQSLLAAALSTLCAVAWGINCALDVTMGSPVRLGRDAVMTLLWACSALCWWQQWRSERRRGADGLPR